MSNIAEFADVPEYSVTGNVTLEDVLNKAVKMYGEESKKVNGPEMPLSNANPIMLCLRVIAGLNYQGLQVAEKKARATSLKDAEGAELDNMALPFGVKRNGAAYAVAKVRFTLSEVQKSAVMIPEGTRVRTGAGIYFATTEYAQVNPGDLYADVTVQAEADGTGCNGVPVGGIDTLVDPIPYMSKVENIEESTGGTDVESDDNLTWRIYLSPSAYSSAGPKDAYEYWARTFRADVEKAIAISPKDVDCTVYIFFMLSDGKLPSETDIEAMTKFMMDEARRPMCDKVIAKAPEEVEYSIDFTYYIGASSQKSAETIQENVAKAVEDFKTWQRTIGRDVSPTELTYRLRDAGVKRVVIRQPEYKVIECSNERGPAVVQIPKLSGTPQIVYGGIEDD